MAKNYTAPSSADREVARSKSAVGKKTPVSPVVFDEGRPERPSSNKNDAVVNAPNTGSNGGVPYPKPIVLPPVDPQDTGK
jgi:hypothetical protein